MTKRPEAALSELHDATMDANAAADMKIARMAIDQGEGMPGVP